MVLQICEIKDPISPGFSHHQLKLPSSFHFSQGTISRPFTIPRVKIHYLPKKWGEQRLQDQQ